MAKTPTHKFTDVDILFSDGATSPVFSAFCGIDTVSININTETNSFNIPECPTDDDAVSYTEDEVSAVQWTVDIEAFHNDALWDFLDDWIMNNINSEKTIRIFNKKTDNSEFYYALPVKLINPNLSGGIGEKWRNGFTLNGQAKPVKVTLP